MAQTLFEQTAQIGTCPSTPLQNAASQKHSCLFNDKTNTRPRDCQGNRKTDEQDAIKVGTLLRKAVNQKGILPLVQDHEGR